MIAGFDRKYLGRYFSTTHLRVNLRRNAAKAGAPLLNFKGEVVGILGQQRGQRIGLLRAADRCRRKNPSRLCALGDARHGWIGIDVQEGNKRWKLARYDTKFEKTRRAAGSGLQTWRHPFAGRNVPVHQPEDVIDASFFISAGDSVPITVIRGNQKLTFTVQACFD